MKKIYIIALVLLAIATQGMAQKFIDIYQNGKVAGSMFSSDIDSISITGSDVFSRRINFWRKGSPVKSYIACNVDSIKVFQSEEEPLAYLGILGFNQELYTKPIDILASSTSSLFNDFVNNLTHKDGTLLYYGVDTALDMFTQYDFTTPLSSVNLITFTDGLDQGSMMMNSNFKNEEEYLSYLSQKISSTFVRGLPLTAYSLGLKGSDVTNYTQFQNNLRHLATSDENAIEVSNMTDVKEKLQKIADQIISISNRQSISMKIPGQSDETRVRFTFDGETPDNSSMYIDGFFNLADRSLYNIAYCGISSSTGNIVEGTQEGIFVTYTFTGLQRADGNGLIPTDNIHQYNLAKGSTSWQINSEFTPFNNIQTSITHSGTAIMLVLDCSNSLGSEFSNMKYYAKDFIKRVSDNTASFSIYSPTTVNAEIDEDLWVVNLNWDNAKYAEFYTVYRSKWPNSNFNLVADSLTTTSWCDEVPLHGANYYRIFSNGHGITSQSGITSDIVRFEIGTPQNVTALLESDGKTVYVSWDSAEHAESYNIYRSKNKSSGFSLIVDGVTNLSWIDELPLFGSNYYRVQAVGHGITSETSSSSNEVYVENGTGHNGSYSNPYTVEDAIAAGSGSGVYVKAYIVGYVSGQVLAEGAHFTADGCDVKTNLLIADSPSETNVNNCMPVQLPSGAVRTGLNLHDNPNNLGKQVLLYGNIEKYFGATGLKSVSYAEINGTSIGSKP